jgi:effector-binding domain-containing protein
LLKIGDFSKTNQVPIKTLRYYDEIGLLKPSEVDRHTRYRFYTITQIPRLNRILAFKDLGFTLEQIAQLLDENLSAEHIRGMLRMKRAEIERNLEEEQARLARVEARLRQIELENQMPIYEIVLKKVDSIKAACLRDVIESYGSVGHLYGELFTALELNGMAPAGPPIAIFHDQEYRERDADVEAALPIVHEGIFRHDRVQIQTLPGMDMASLLYTGAYDDFTSVYQVLMGWIQQNRYQVAGPNREIYLHGPGEGISSTDYMTEIQFPVKKV